MPKAVTKELTDPSSSESDSIHDSDEEFVEVDSNDGPDDEDYEQFESSSAGSSEQWEEDGGSEDCILMSSDQFPARVPYQNAGNNNDKGPATSQLANIHDGVTEGSRSQLKKTNPKTISEASHQPEASDTGAETTPSDLDSDDAITAEVHALQLEEPRTTN